LPEFTAKPFRFIGDHEASRLGVVTTLYHPQVRVRFNRRFKETRDRDDQLVDVSEFIGVKGMRALGNRLSPLPVTEVVLEPADEAREAAAAEAVAASRAATTAPDDSSEPAEGTPDEPAVDGLTPDHEVAGALPLPSQTHDDPPRNPQPPVQPTLF
jgi:topoisomerase-4 subunit A